MKVLITGVAGFIGLHVARALLARGDEVVGVDNMNSYYDPRLKAARIAELMNHRLFRFHQADIADRPAVESLFEREGVTSVVHLAAQAGVRYSIDNPNAYVDSNLVGFGNILEGCRKSRIDHLVYASSSSVYGGNTKVPFAETDPVDEPVSLYAATKKANELMAHAYSHLFQFPATGLRFFTVYGPWGRPDMAYYSFTEKMLSGEEIPVYNQGNMLRDFTYIDDIVEGVVRVLDRPPSPRDGRVARHQVFNIGNESPVPLLEMIATLERHLGVRATIRWMPMQAGDVVATHAEMDRLRNWTGFQPSTTLSDGLAKFVSWYRRYHSA